MHGHGTFPAFKQLEARSSQDIRRRLAIALCMAPASPGYEIVREVLDRGELVDGVSADSEDFDLRAMMTELGLAWADSLYLNWSQYDHIDEVATEDMATHFSDIWYPSLDDLDIFDSSMAWILSVFHHGAVSILKTGRNVTGSRAP